MEHISNYSNYYCYLLVTSEQSKTNSIKSFCRWWMKRAVKCVLLFLKRAFEFERKNMNCKIEWFISWNSKKSEFSAFSALSVSICTTRIAYMMDSYCPSIKAMWIEIDQKNTDQRSKCLFSILNLKKKILKDIRHMLNGMQLIEITFLVR